MARGRPREFDPDAALDHVLPLFWRDGFDGASVQELADAVGVSEPSFYAAYGNKEALYLAALQRCGALHASRRTIEDRLARAQQDAHLPADADVQAMAACFNTVLSGLSVQARAGAEREPPLRVVDEAMRSWPS